MVKRATRIIAAVAAAAAAGCVSIAPDPVDWSREAAEWRKAGAAGEAPSIAEIDWRAAKELLLVMSPQLNLARLKADGAAKSVRAAGWWEDPELGLDLARFLRKSPNWEYAAGVNFTVPVTGLPRLEREAAEAYGKAAQWDVKCVEAEAIAALYLAWREWENAAALHALARARRAAAENVAARAERLAAAGEISDMDALKLRNEARAAATELESAATALRNAKAKTLECIGASPATLAQLCGAAELPPPLTAAGAEALAAHPAIMGRLARLEAAETELKAELRKQIPEIQLNPGWANEERENAVTLGVGFKLPLWNRNRKGIAESETNRNVSKAETIMAWKELVWRAERVKRRLAAAETARRRLAEESVPAAARRVANAEKLFAAGEIGIGEYWEIQSESFGLRRELAAAELECAAAEAERILL